MALSGIALDGKELLDCEVDRMPKALVKAAVFQTSARDKRQFAAEFGRKATGLREQAEPYIDKAREHESEGNTASAGVAAILERRGQLGKAGAHLFNVAVREYAESRIYQSISEPFTAEAMAYEEGAEKFRLSAHMDQFKVAIYKTINAVQSMLRLV